MISHMFFANDSLFFCKANQQAPSSLKSIFDLYGSALGQLLNFTKSILSFSPNTNAEIRNLFTSTLGMEEKQCHETYLGLSSMAGRAKKELFNSIKSRV